MAEFDLAHDPEFVEVKPGAMSRLIDSLSENTPHWLAALLDLPTAPAPLTGEAAAAERRQQMLKVFADRLKVQVQGHSTAILIAFTSENPVLAAEVANAIAASYAQLSVLDKAKAAQDALATMTRRSTELRDQAVAADSAVEDYRNSAHLIEGTNGNIITAQIGEYNSSLVQAQADLATAQSRIVDKNGSAADPDNAPAVLASPVIQHLREEQARQNGLLAQEKTRQGDSYPGVSGRKLALLDLAKQIGVETSSIITAQRNAADAAQARVNLLAAKLADVWKQSASFAAADVHLRQLKLEASVQHNLYESYLRRIQEISQQVGTAQPYVDIISPAEVPRRTSFPNIQLLLPCIFVAALVLASVSVTATEMLSSGFRSARQIVQMFGDRPVELIPPMYGGRPRLLRWLWPNAASSAPSGPFTEAIHALRIQSRSYGAGMKTVLFTSALKSEGKTAIAVAFARQEAQSGLRVLMIDADLRRPSLHRVFGGSLTGLTDLVLKRNTPKTVLQQDASSGVYYLAAGKLSTSPIDLLASTEFRQLLKGSEQRFDRIIIDSPPVLAVADARVLAGYVNQTVYIVRWSKTPRRLARLGYEVLRQNGARLLGPVFTQVGGAGTRYDARPVLPRLEA